VSKKGVGSKKEAGSKREATRKKQGTTKPVPSVTKQMFPSSPAFTMKRTTVLFRRGIA
jgi:hypothetical protein